MTNEKFAKYRQDLKLCFAENFVKYGNIISTGFQHNALFIANRYQYSNKMKVEDLKF